MAEPGETAWTRTMGELRERGWTQGKLQAWLASREIEISQASLSDLACGVTKEPKYRVGAALLELHKSGELAPATV